MKERCAVVFFALILFCLSGVLRARAQDKSPDLKIEELESRIDIERDALSELRQRKDQAQREKSALMEEIEQEAARISKLNREIKPAPDSARKRASRKRSAEPVRCAPLETAQPGADLPDDPPAGPAIDPESQAEIDRLVAMREKLIAERDSLEKIVKPAPGAP